MPSACALGINSGILLSLTMQENLRIFPHCLFTQGGVKATGSHIATFLPCENAFRARFFLYTKSPRSGR